MIRSTCSLVTHIVSGIQSIRATHLVDAASNYRCVCCRISDAYGLNYCATARKKRNFRSLLSCRLNDKAKIADSDISKSLAASCDRLEPLIIGQYGMDNQMIGGKSPKQRVQARNVLALHPVRLMNGPRSEAAGGLNPTMAGGHTREEDEGFQTILDMHWAHPKDHLPTPT